MFKVKNLNKLNSGKSILREINFEIDHGRIGIFLGNSGVGKSTLLRVLNNLESYDSGTFSLDGKPFDLKNVNKDHIMGLVFQHFNLFENLSVIDNITLALIKSQKKTKKEANSIAGQLLDRYGLSDKSNSSVNKLSGGQKQRLAIARAIALDTQIICMDEPTSALDPRLTNQVAEYITKLANENRIVLIATHDTNLVSKLKSQLFLMKEGTIAETGFSEDCINNPGAYPLLSNFLSGQR
jgi:polar amino acid transport system ATP-binding protein